MGQMEDRIKQMLEDYQSTLPEGDLAEFRALLDNVADPVEARRRAKAAYLAWLVPVAVAAGLALFFILRHDSEPEPDIVTVINCLEAETVVDVTDDSVPSAYIAEVNRPVMPEAAVVTDAIEVTEPAAIQESPEVAEIPEASEKDEDAVISTCNTDGYSETAPKISSTESFPFAPTKMKPVTAGIIGGTGAVAIASLPLLLKGSAGGYLDCNLYGFSGTGLEKDEKTGKDVHHIPLRAALSLQIPLSDRWAVTTGVGYSWYSSTIEYSISGRHQQNVHYLGVPVRADFTIAGNRWLAVYVGAGASVDFCLAASDAGRQIPKDGAGFSLEGAGGIQLNFSRYFGFYLEPALSWNIPSESRVLSTYKTEHPFMFTVSTGLRIKMPTKHTK